MELIFCCVKERDDLMVNIIKEDLDIEEALNLRVKTLNDIIKEKDNEISFLKSKIQDLKNMLDYWKDKFNKLISFICNFSLKILETFTAAFIISSAYLSESEKKKYIAYLH